MTSPTAIALFWAALFPAALLQSQTPGPSAEDLARMRLVIREAGELQLSRPAEVLGKLEPLLTELHLLQQGGNLTAESSTVYQEALALKIRAQSRLLAAESEITPSLKQLLLLNPRMDTKLFNPREQAWIDRIRSSEMGNLTLQSEPAACSVYYLDQELGTTPLNISLIAGTYRLLLRKGGYRDHELNVVVNPSELVFLQPVLRRSVVEIPLSTTTANVQVLVDGQEQGSTRDYSQWLKSLPPEHVPAYEAIVRGWGGDPSAGSFFRLLDVPIDRPVTLEFRSPCYEPLSMNLHVTEQDVDWTKPYVVRPELARVALTKDLGAVEITSQPSGAEVWIDGNPEGKTPAKLSVCVGPHRLRVLHPAGQYMREIVVERGGSLKLDATVRPALAFLGVYSSDQGAFRALPQESEALSRKLASKLSAFTDLRLSVEDVQSARKRGDLPFEQVLNVASRPANMESLVKQVAFDSGRADLILIGTRTGGRFTLQLFSSLQPLPDVVDLPDLNEGSMDYLADQLEKAASVHEQIEAPDIGMDLLDASQGMVVLRVRAGSAAAKAQIEPGMMVRTVDGKPMNLRQLRVHLRSLKTGQPVKIEVLTESGLRPANLPVARVGAQFPWGSETGFPNAYLATLKHLFELGPATDEGKYAALSLSLGLIKLGQWKLALDYLGKAAFEPQKVGVGQGTVLYYQGRCHEQLGDKALAKSYYTRARELVESTLGGPDGLSVAKMADRRIEFLNRSSQ